MKIVGKSIPARVEEAMLRYSMPRSPNRIGVAVSGGADSVALLHALVELVSRQGWWLVALHCNHGLRGNESEEDEQFVRQRALDLGVDVCVQRTEAGGDRENLEQRVRRLRYECFASWKSELGLDWIATGHTRSDQGETVLFRLLRGSGTAGLAGIRPVTQEGIVRPLLEISRGEIRDWLRERGFAWREDSSNQESRFARNRIRTTLLPQLEREWNPQLESALSHTARIAFEEEQYWERELDRYLPASVRPHRFGVIVDVSSFPQYPVALRRRLLRAAVAMVRGNTRRLTFEHWDRILRLTEGRATGQAGLPGLIAIRSFEEVLLSPRRLCRGFAGKLTPGGRLELPGQGCVLRMELEQSRYNEDAVDLDGDQASDGLEVRSWRPGDGYQPAGHASRRKMKDLFQETRIPLWDRQDWPMVVREGQILWSRRFGPAATVAATANSQRILRIWEEASESK